MRNLPTLENAFLRVKDGKISGFGRMSELSDAAAKKTEDASGRYVFPSFVDSHTHLIFPAYREEEFVMKIGGASYADIAAKGGGILNSARRLAEASEDQLFESALQRINQIISTGTGAVEIKSGYGLSLEGELKMLRVAKRIQHEVSIPVKTTFLGAHAVPKGISKEDYVNLVIEEMIPAVVDNNLADYIDVFCEDGFFSREDTVRICEAGVKYGLRPRIHANQLGRSGGVQAGIAVNAISVDHLENMGQEEIDLLAKSNVLATVLPGAAFFLNMEMPPARKMLEAGLPMVIASDYNPGSSPSGNMPLMISLACIRMRMLPEEAINAATVNAAFALGLENECGSITIGKRANFFITAPMPSIAYLPYAYGSSLVDHVYVDGKAVEGD